MSSTDGKRVHKMERCRDYRRLIGAEVDGTADAEGRAALRRHLDACADCAREVRELQRVRRLTRDLPTLAPSAALKPALAARLRAQRASWLDRLFGSLRPNEIRLAAGVALLLVLAIGVGVVALHGPGATSGPATRVVEISSPAPPSPQAPAPADEYLQGCGLVHGTLDQDQAYWGADSVQLATYAR
ncbi:MAG: hypothetical protein FJX74_14585 [Armatimonadetes bacterium]|nr:hypothetical protein [Armatimonadota bacterium]